MWRQTWTDQLLWFFGGHLCSRVQANLAGLIRAVDRKIYNRCCTLVHQKSQSPVWNPRTLSHWNLHFNSCRLFLRVCYSAGLQVRGSIGRKSWAFVENPLFRSPSRSPGSPISSSIDPFNLPCAKPFSTSLEKNRFRSSLEVRKMRCTSRQCPRTSSTMRFISVFVWE